MGQQGSRPRLLISRPLSRVLVPSVRFPGTANNIGADIHGNLTGSLPFPSVDVFGYPWDVHGMSMGSPQDVHGMPMGRPWDVQGCSWDVQGKRGASLFQLPRAWGFVASLCSLFVCSFSPLFSSFSLAHEHASSCRPSETARVVVLRPDKLAIVPSF